MQTLIILVSRECICTQLHNWLELLWAFVNREANKSHHCLLSGQERVPWLDPVFQKRWRPNPQPSSPRVWHNLHSNTETGERSLPSWTWCWASLILRERYSHSRYSQAPELDRWSASSHGVSEPPKQDKRRSYELQLPSADDNPISPGYAEPLCVSVDPSNPLTSSCEHICPAAVC